ncbi:MAG: Conserved TM helix repeat-containing protein [Candidatus Uhrbacteria bacterium GW2011_GWE2_46_68]|uniref:Conserved TM helix repeat-containing protein n=2 Tax=Candidatus Uhriibacteriota TaxID=1752732 RepID=A0A0G1Q803_9BACT|nr:MAG: Conserved TM helix repeat-containing protein [Candidatus Uhrbacteria bacterium GW2011_GWF2_46_218]KKU41114.1 MAG: Conserved TM helix repeat-containing protein [Candidatus Uhrbacteria bacterium GW2011_GWE2_46_68]
MFQEPFLELWESLIAYLPQILGAVVVFLVGMLLALVLSKVIRQVVQVLGIDQLAAHFEIKAFFEKIGIHLHIGRLLAWIVKWFCIIVTLIATTDILGWDQVTGYLQEVVRYLPNVMISVIILLAGILLANFVKRVVKSAVAAAQLESADFLSGTAKWAILIFTFMAALVQLQIAPDLIRVLFTGLVAMLALSGGLAFGLGGKEHASRVLDRLRKDISSDR